MFSACGMGALTKKTYRKMKMKLIKKMLEQKYVTTGRETLENSLLSTYKETVSEITANVNDEISMKETLRNTLAKSNRDGMLKIVSQTRPINDTEKLREFLSSHNFRLQCRDLEAQDRNIKKLDIEIQLKKADLEKRIADESQYMRVLEGQQHSILVDEDVEVYVKGITSKRLMSLGNMDSESDRIQTANIELEASVRMADETESRRYESIAMNEQEQGSKFQQELTAMIMREFHQRTMEKKDKEAQGEIDARSADPDPVRTAVLS